MILPGAALRHADGEALAEATRLTSRSVLARNHAFAAVLALAQGSHVVACPPEKALREKTKRLRGRARDKGRRLMEREQIKMILIEW